MSDLIDRQTALDMLKSMMQDCFPEAEEELDAVVTTVREIPSTEPERKKGKWIGDCCSCCGVSKYNYIKMVDDECGPFGTWNFCPNCDAEMTRGENGKA